MLTRDLLEVTRRKGKIFPKFAGKQDIDLARKVIAIYKAGMGKKYKIVVKALKNIENAGNFRKVRGFAKVFEDNFVKTSLGSNLDPLSVRMFLFERGFVTSKKERDEIIELAAKYFGVSPKEIENAMYADIEDEMIVAEVESVSPDRLIRLYNLSLLQTTIFNSLRLTFWTSSNYKEIFRAIKYLGLMYEIFEDKGRTFVEVTGPASILKMTRKYGTSMAKLIPFIIKARDWWLKAEIVDNDRIFILEIDSSRKELFPDLEEKIEYDSSLEEEFARKLRLLGFEVLREPRLIKAGRYAFIPDFLVRKGKAEVFVEIVGFWTREYLEKKLRKIREVDLPLIVVAREEMGIDKSVPNVITFSRRIPVGEVVKKINEFIQESMDFKEDVVVVNRVREVPSEYVILGKYAIRKCVYEKLKREVEELNPRDLDDIKPILSKYRVGESILPYLGYEVKWVGLGKAILVKSSECNRKVK